MTERPAAEPMDRRRLLRLAAGGALGIGTMGLPSPVGATTSRATGDPVTMAMHIHGSFSEGSASMDAHLHQAQRLGVDVVWWTDHDFRVAGLGYRTALGFDGETEYQNGCAWTWVPYSSEGIAAGHDFISDPHSPSEEGWALRLRTTASLGDSWATYLLEGQAWNYTYSTSYVDTVLELDVLPELTGPDAEVVIEIGSSYRPVTAGRAAGLYRLQYRIGSVPGRWLEDEGRLGVVGVVAGAPTAWQRVRMDLRADHAALWPDTVAGDASITQFRVGVRARNGATAQGVVDRLRFRRSRQSIADGMALLRGMVREYRGRYPGITQYAASEVSLVNHLNAFGGDGTLPTYDTNLPVKDETLSAQLEMVRFLRGHGAVVGINHPTPGTALAHKLVTTRGLGANVIEIGTSRQVEALSQAYDTAARNAVFLTATGVTDDHAGSDWLAPDEPRWLTGAWASGTTSDDLCAAVSAGRAWFFDPLWWRGELDLLVDGRAPMGGVLLTRHRTVSVRVTATRLPAGSSLELVVGRCDRAGSTQLQPVNRSIAVPARQVVRGRWSTLVGRGGGVYVRAMVRRADGGVVGFSNPTWVLPARLGGVVPVPRPRRYRDG